MRPDPSLPGPDDPLRQNTVLVPGYPLPRRHLRHRVQKGTRGGIWQIGPWDTPAVWGGGAEQEADVLTVDPNSEVRQLLGGFLPQA